MSRAFTSCMIHFLDEKGAVLSPVPIKSKKLFENLQTIISFVSKGSHAGQPDSTSLSCWNSPKKKRCSGKIDASLDLQYHIIVWHCLLCGNHGTISRWKNTIFDKGLPRMKGEQSAACSAHPTSLDYPLFGKK